MGEEETFDCELYSYWRSSCSYRVRIALNLKGLKYKYHAVHLRNGEQKQETFTHINPNQTVPVLITLDGKTLGQSLAIIEYLDELHPDPPLLPRDPFLKAKVRELAYYIAMDIQPVSNLRVMNMISTEQSKKNEYAKTVITQGLQRFEKAVEEFAGKYCFGDQVTLVDLCLVPQIYNAIRFEVDMNQFPIVSRVYQNLTDIQEFKDAHPSVQIDAEN